MKKILYIILIALLSVVAGLAKATPLSGSGTETDPYIIATTADWTEFCDNHATYKNSYIKMANFVTAATNKYFNDTFSGTFDGDGYTLTVNISGERVAPFMQVSNGTIKNLRVAGSITGSANHTSGLVSMCTNGTTCTIQNCIVSATITNTENLGGFIGHGTAATTINMTDCVFNGTLNYSGASNGTNKNDNTFSKKVGGFVSWEGNGTTIFNLSRCLFDGTINCTAGFTPFIVKYSGCDVTGCDAASCLYTVAQSSGFPAAYTIFDGTSAIGQTANQIVTTMNNAGGNGWRVFKGKAEPTMRPLRTLDNIPDGWTVTASGDPVTVTDGTATISAGATVVLTPTNTAKVKKVTLVDATPTTSCRLILLDTVQHDLVAQDCDTLTGELQHNVKISIADGATVTLKDATINGTDNSDYQWAGITCLGNATIILEGTNTVKGFYNAYPGIYVPGEKNNPSNDKTLTIQGAGSLTASSNGWGSGIGGGYDIACGNIEIQGGNITATGQEDAAGIGCGWDGSCGAITISGGTVNAIGGSSNTGNGSGAAGIGSGNNASCGAITISGGTVNATGGIRAAGIGCGWFGDCGTITITDGVTQVTATKGENALNSIGRAADYGTCGTITFGTQQMYDGSTWNPTPTSGETYGGLKLIISNTNDTWTLTPGTDLSTINANYTASDGETLTGTLEANVKISIAAGATVTLNNVTINGTNSNSYKWAGITCEGNATIILKDGTENTVTGFYENYPGIYVPANSTLTIKGGSEGTGKLIASSNGYGAGIGGWYYNNCGNINIQSGDIKATGGQMAAGIGGAGSGNFGTITITGGTIEATGGDYAAGIGSGNNGSCGDIMITSDVTSVTATKGSYAPNSIGAGLNGSCGTVTIGSATGAITDSPYTYPPQP